ncbi:Hypothetical predicted protein [Octopus vulgaris]|uniref:Uncharacterized protein n=1 Tax=Octopus vulgaris TaxID=6645 RepID=A0AA36EXA4_OCTVU|nr:Hypothetical predicted protein [Octopus vulgaris]
MDSLLSKRRSEVLTESLGIDGVSVDIDVIDACIDGVSATIDIVGAIIDVSTVDLGVIDANIDCVGVAIDRITFYRDIQTVADTIYCIDIYTAIDNIDPATDGDDVKGAGAAVTLCAAINGSPAVDDAGAVG